MYRSRCTSAYLRGPHRYELRRQARGVLRLAVAEAELLQLLLDAVQAQQPCQRSKDLPIKQLSVRDAIRYRHCLQNFRHVLPTRKHMYVRELPTVSSGSKDDVISQASFPQ